MNKYILKQFNFLRTIFNRRFSALLFSISFFVIWYFVLDKYLGYPRWSDWDQSLSYFNVASFSSIKEYGFPFWNLRFCGGYPSIGHPTNALLSPLISLFWIFPTPMALRLWILIMSIIGYFGIYRYLRSLNILKWSSIFGSMIFVFGGMYSLAVWGAGMYQLLPLILIPHVLFFLDKYLLSEKDLWKSLYSLVFWLVFMFFSGLHYIHIVFSCLILLLILKPHISWTKKIKAILFVIILFIFLAGPKLFPMLSVLSRYPRIIPEDISGMGVFILISTLVSRDILISNHQPINYFLWGTSFGIDENSNYLGIGVIIFFLIGMIAAWGIKQRRYMYSLFIFFLWLSLGVMVFPSLYSILRNLPYMEMFRVAQRFRFVWIIPFVYFASLGFQKVFESKSSKYKRLFGVLVVFMIFLDLIGTNVMNIRNMGRSQALPSSNVISNNNTLIYECKPGVYPQTNMYPTMSGGGAVGDASCYDPLPVTSANVCNFQNRYRNFAILSTGEKIEIDYLGNNHIRLRGNFPKGSELILNTTYDSGWSINYGGNNYLSKRITISPEMANYLGYVFPTEYEGVIDFKYYPEGFNLGLLTFVIAMIGWIYVLKKK